MNFALLGIDDDVLVLARALAASGEHRIVSIFEAGAHAEALKVIAPAATISDEWESLLLENVVDCVIVGRGSTSADVRDDQLRKLVQAKIPLIVVHPACEAIVGYEIEMIRRDVGGIIVPYVPGLQCDAVPALATLASPDSEIGQAEQLVFERRMTGRKKVDVLAQLARDSAMIRKIVGSIKTVSASGSLAKDAVSLSVQMTSERGCLARWSVEPTTAHPGATLTLHGDRGKAVCEMPSNGEWSLTLPGEQVRRIDPQLYDIDRLLEDLSATAESQPRLSWLDACRSTEVADTVPRCLARGKTIELYNEEHTEEGAFKGVMAVGGCLIMLIGLLMVVMIAVIEGLQLPLYRFSLWSNWPLYICAGFFFFLLLQLFRFVARGR